MALRLNQPETSHTHVLSITKNTEPINYQHNVPVYYSGRREEQFAFGSPSQLECTQGRTLSIRILNDSWCQGGQP